MSSPKQEAGPERGTHGAVPGHQTLTTLGGRGSSSVHLEALVAGGERRDRSRDAPTLDRG